MTDSGGKLAVITVILPGRALEELKRKAESEGKTLEELVSEAALRELDVADPQVKAELHLKLCEKYMREAEEFLARKDYVQASEKAWEASSQVVKALAAGKGKELRSHASLWEYVDELAGRLGDMELRHLWRTANVLLQNFYESWMPPREIELSVRDVKAFIEKLKPLIERSED